MYNWRVGTLIGALVGGWLVTAGAACGDGVSEPTITPSDTTPSSDTIPLDGRGGGVIAYSKQPGPGSGIHEVFAVNADGSGDRKMIDANIGLNHQDWAPDAQRMVAVGYVDPYTWSIHTFRMDGSGLERLTHVGGVEDTEPAWSPDGTQIAFTRMYPAENGRSELWLMDADGSNQRSLDVAGFGARWSPDGSRFVFASDEGADWDIFVCNVDGTEVTRLSSTPFDEMSPVWSPSGAEIAFHSNEDGDHELFVMASDGTNIRKLTDNSSDEFYPRWSSDGASLAFNSDQSSTGHWEVYVIASDGSGLRRVTNTTPPRTAIAPVWRPSLGG